MRLLLDSNVLLWSIFHRARLTPMVLDLISDESNQLFVSRASLWELSIKVAKGKLILPESSIRYVLDQLDRTGISILPIDDRHILQTETLPPHHHDPFDRMIVAQAMVERLTILSSDDKMPSYAVRVIWR